MKDMLDIIIPLIYFTGIVIFFVAIYLISRIKQQKDDESLTKLMQKSKNSLMNSDNMLKETVELRKAQVRNQEKIIDILEEINKKIKS